MLIKVKVFPESKNPEVLKKTEDSFEIKVTEKPKMGQANEATITLLAYYFEIPRQKIRLIKGAKDRHKIFEIRE